MHKDLKSFFLLTSSALVSLFLLSSLFVYNYFDLSSRLSSTEQSQLMLGGLGAFVLILIILYLLANKFLFPILSLNRFILSHKEENVLQDFSSHYDDEISFIGEYVAQMREELDKSKETLNQLCLVDTLTGVKNRRYFFEFGEGLFKLAKRNKEPLSLIMFDVDHLKNINIKYGNTTGDNILAYLMEVTESHIRKSDILVRFSGAEFAILLPRTNEEAAEMVAKKIQDTLETAEVKHKAEAYFTISVGISSLHNDDIFLRSLSQRAEHALANAKEKGRNRIELS